MHLSNVICECCKHVMNEQTCPVNIPIHQFQSTGFCKLAKARVLSRVTISPPTVRWYADNKTLLCAYYVQLPDLLVCAAHVKEVNKVKTTN